MRRSLLTGLGVTGVIAAGAVAAHAAGSHPDTPGAAGPLPACGGAANCHRARVPLDAAPEAVRAAAVASVRDSGHWFTGRAVRVAPTVDGLRAVFKTGPFRDDVLVAVEAAGSGSVLHLRSASRVGERDLGVNRARVRRLVAAVRARLGA